MKRRKILAILLSIMIFLVFTACSTGNNAAGEALSFKGEWKEIGPLKIGIPEDWFFNESASKARETKAEIRLSDQKEISDKATTVRVFFQENPATTREYTLEQIGQMSLIEADRPGAEYERVTIGDLTFIKIDYLSSIMKAPERLYVYRSGVSKDKQIEVTIKLYGPDIDGEIERKIVDSLRVQLPENFKKVKNKVSDFTGAKTGEVVELEHIRVDTPQDWSVIENKKGRIKLTTAAINNGYVTVAQYDTATSHSAQEAVAIKNENYKPAPPITSMDIAGLQYYCMKPKGDIFLISADNFDGSQRVEVSGMFCSLEQAMPLLETISFQ